MSIPAQAAVRPLAATRHRRRTPRLGTPRGRSGRVPARPDKSAQRRRRDPSYGHSARSSSSSQGTSRSNARVSPRPQARRRSVGVGGWSEIAPSYACRLTSRRRSLRLPPVLLSWAVWRVGSAVGGQDRNDPVWEVSAMTHHRRPRVRDHRRGRRAPGDGEYAGRRLGWSTPVTAARGRRSNSLAQRASVPVLGAERTLYRYEPLATGLTR